MSEDKLNIKNSEYNYKEGDFPVAENLCKTPISLPVHEFITEKEIIYVSNLIKKFYKSI